jgi:hypothetical protein
MGLFLDFLDGNRSEAQHSQVVEAGPENVSGIQPWESAIWHDRDCLNEQVGPGQSALGL